MTQGRFILSLDCEGKWGIADHLKPRDDVLLSTDRLKESYAAILNLLDLHMVAATFAIVGLFRLSPDQLRAQPLDEIDHRFKYCVEATRRIRAGDFDGWTGAWLTGMIGKAHEIASHGNTHTPFDQMTAQDVEFELSLLPITEGQTLVFPRNRVAHLALLAEHGFSGYRLCKESRSFERFMSEYNVLAESETDPLAAKLQPIVAGHFVNWRSGLRKLVPIGMTRRRAAHMLDHAARTGGVVHYWTHPENVATAPQTLDVLRVILEEVAIRRDRGEIEVIRQDQYCRSLQ